MEHGHRIHMFKWRCGKVTKLNHTDYIWPGVCHGNVGLLETSMPILVAYGCPLATVWCWGLGAGDREWSVN